MAVRDEHAREKRRRQGAIVACSLVAGAFEAAHCLAWTSHVNAWSVAFMTLGVFLELQALTAALDFGLLRRRPSTWALALSGSIAVGVGMAEGFAGWAIQSGFDVPIFGRTSNFRAGVVAQFGAVNGLVGLGLWATAVVIPFAVRDANARALEAEKLRTAAELARLRANLQPHFLLNTLSTVAGLVMEDPRDPMPRSISLRPYVHFRSLSLRRFRRAPPTPRYVPTRRAL